MKDPQAAMNFRLRAQTNLSREGKTIPKGKAFNADPNSALALVLDGSAELWGQQANPPRFIVDALLERLLDLEAVGPKCIREALVKKAQEKLTPHGIPAPVVEDRQIAWHGFHSAKAAVDRAIDQGGTPVPVIQSQLLDCWTSFRSACRRDRTDEVLSAAEMRARSVVCEPAVRWRIRGRVVSDGEPASISRARVHTHAPADWVQFYLALQDLQHKYSGVFLRCLQDGRVLAFERTHSYFRLIGPWAWASERRPTLKTAKSCEFQMTRDLPSTWFGEKSKVTKGEERKRKLHEAKKFIEELYLEAAPNHADRTKDSVRSEAMQEFGVTRNLADDAWNIANIPKWKERGRRPGRSHGAPSAAPKKTKG